MSYRCDVQLIRLVLFDLRLEFLSRQLIYINIKISKNAKGHLSHCQVFLPGCTLGSPEIASHKRARGCLEIIRARSRYSLQYHFREQDGIHDSDDCDWARKLPIKQQLH